MTSPSNSTKSLLINLADSAIHFVDEDSGTIFSRVHQALGACILAKQFENERSSLRSSLSLHIGSPPPCSATDLDVHIESLPSLCSRFPHRHLLIHPPFHLGSILLPRSSAMPPKLPLLKTGYQCSHCAINDHRCFNSPWYL